MSKEKSLDAQIIERSMKDPTFRQNLLSNPKATLEKEMKMSFPAGVKVEVHEEGENVRHLVIPKAAGKKPVELSDAQLDAAAGGARGEKDCCTCGSSTHQTFNL